MNAQSKMTAVFKAVVAKEVERLGKEADAYKAVAAASGLGYDYVYQIYKDKPAHKPKQPSVEAISGLARRYSDDDEFSEIFAGLPGYIARLETESKSDFLPGFEKLSIPLLAQAGSMGPGTDLMHEEVVVGRLTVSPQWVARVVKPTKADNLRFIHGYGDSMEPTFADGDILLVDLGLHDPKVDGVYVLEANDRIYIKRVRQRLDGQYEISSDNPTVKTVDVLNGEHQVKVHGKVVWAWNGKKM